MAHTFVIGDIHGCYQSLVRLLERIDPDPARDTLVFLGDYIDRGPQSMEVVDELLRLRKEFPAFVALMGNHEQMFLRYLEGRDEQFFLDMGGDRTLASYHIDSGTSTSDAARLVPAAHQGFLHNLAPYWEDDEYIYVHAGLRPGLHLSQQPMEWLYWGREKFVDSHYDFGKRVIFGHTPFEVPQLDPNKIGIDTGAVYGGRLTCLILPDLEFVSVPGPLPPAWILT